MSEKFDNINFDKLTPASNPEWFNADGSRKAICEVKESRTDNLKVLSPTTLVLKRFFRSKLSIAGLIILITLFVFSFLGPIFSPWGETETDKTEGKGSYRQQEFTFEVNGETFTVYDVTYDTLSQNIYGPVDSRHWLGTDHLGMDVFTRLMYGGQVSLTLGFAVIILETILGVLLGGLAGYFGGWVDNLIMRIVDIFMCVPTLPILLIASALIQSWNIPGRIQIYFLMIMLTVLGWAGMARLVRGQILSLREQEYMVAAEASGLSVSRKIWKHLVPNVLPQLIVSMTLGLGGIILTEATMSYLGLGVPIPYAAWGSMIQKANDSEILSRYPNMWVPAGILIVLAVLAFNFVGDGLRDAFDPRMKR
jgi:peptide/nickel transport system permease protein